MIDPRSNNRVHHKTGGNPAFVSLIAFAQISIATGFTIR